MVEGMNIPILFENQDYLIINKPAGLVVHSDGKTDEPTVVDWILEYHPEIQGVGENMHVSIQGKDIEINRPGIVHRIDRETSGCLVIAKNQMSFEYLKDQFKNRHVEKNYTALVYGSLKDDFGFIDQPIGRSAKDFRMKQAGNNARGELRDAVTEYNVIARYQDPKHKDKQGKYETYTLVSCRPKTGRTHQIRVHMKWMNHPLVADTLYAGKRAKRDYFDIQRMVLHAQSIRFHDPDGQIIEAYCEVPEDIQSVIHTLEKVDF